MLVTRRGPRTMRSLSEREAHRAPMSASFRGRSSSSLQDFTSPGLTTPGGHSCKPSATLPKWGPTHQPKPRQTYTKPGQNVSEEQQLSPLACIWHLPAKTKSPAPGLKALSTQAALRDGWMSDPPIPGRWTRQHIEASTHPDTSSASPT